MRTLCLHGKSEKLSLDKDEDIDIGSMNEINGLKVENSVSQQDRRIKYT